MRLGWMAAAAAVLAMAGVPAQARQAAPTEKLTLKPHRVKGLLLGYGYSLGEYTGEVRSMSSSASMPLFTSGKAKTTFTFGHLGSPNVTTITCAGGESRLGLLWIDFKREALSYICQFEGGPADAAFTLALSQGGIAARIYQPQRAGELTYNGVTLRAMTRKAEGALPVGGGGVMSYKLFGADGQETGSMVRGVLQPSFVVPAPGGKDREAAILLGLILYTFQDPANAKN